jgi:hypothetical protein
MRATRKRKERFQTQEQISDVRTQFPEFKLRPETPSKFKGQGLDRLMIIKQNLVITTYCNYLGLI